jgi:hypothetical protein
MARNKTDKLPQTPANPTSAPNAVFSKRLTKTPTTSRPTNRSSPVKFSEAAQTDVATFETTLWEVQ